MAERKGKNYKQGNRHDKDQQNISESHSKQNNISHVFLDELQGAFTRFNTLPETQRTELYGSQEYLEQFWEYFKKEHPNLLDKIDKKDLPIYIQAIENEGFSLATITKNAGKLSQEFKAEDTEQHVIEESLQQLQKFCADKNNNIPDGTFRKFADAAGFDHSTLLISPDGGLKVIDNLPLLWKDFVKKEGIVLGKTAADHVDRILLPNYNPTERVMVTVALTKIRKELKGSLKTAFDKQFRLPIDIFSPYQDLINFKTEWIQFLADHASEIDEPLAKNLDSVIVTNGDIQKELLKSGRTFDDTKGFSEREQYFRRIFNKLVTRQLFEKTQKTQESIDYYVETMGNTFKQFPPYVNDILSIYQFNDKIIGGIDVSFHSDLASLDAQISDCNTQYATAPDAERKTLRAKMKTLKQEREQRRRQAYIAFLRTKDAALADVFGQLVASKFDFSTLSGDQQQLILNVLVKNKLEDSIKNKVPELLSVKEEELTQFVHDLFDLKKMDLTIPTRHGPVPLTFLKKEFLASVRTQLPSLNDLEDIKNLPLNFVTQLTESNAAFFEDSPIFDSIYTDFAAQNGKFRLNDAYKVRIKKDGKMVEGYLSSYCPIDEKYNDKDYDGKELFLYSQPITSPNQEREIVTRPHDENKSSIPVVIKDMEQSLCDVEILDKKINLNGDAFGALLFGYVLGQQSMNTTMSPEKEKELAAKIGTLDVYKEKEESEEEEIAPIVEQEESKKENSEEKNFEDERKQLKGYQFPGEQYKDSGFVEGSKLYIPFASSEVPPVQTGRAWIQMEITRINRDKGTFTVKFHGGELHLGKSEGASKELSMTPQSLKGIKDAFGDVIYKVPNTKGMSFDQQMAILNGGSVIKDLDDHFGSLKFNGSKFSYTLGNYAGKEVTHFGFYEPKAINEAVDQESGKLILYKIHPNTNGTITVSGDSSAGNYAKNFPARDMDYTTFMLFIKEKGLQPKCNDQIQDITKNIKAEKEETPTTVRGFSINNVVSFFTNGVSKIKDGLKKYDEERAEDLTDLLTSQGQLWGKIGGLLSPLSRVSSSFENMGMEYFLERDNRIWKKVEKRTKYYEDFDYTKIYNMYIKPMLDGTIKIVPHYKIAALLLVHLKKGKGPYAKDPASSSEGNRVGVVLGKEHQQRYLAIREKRIRDLEQNAHVYGGSWADQVKNELVELEMRYMVHVMDGRHMGVNDDDKTKEYYQAKYSKKFCDELEGAYTSFYKQDGVDEGFTKNKDVNFEFARVEYFRLLADRPQQALPFLKVMATKAINDTQWQVFETAVLTGILSGVFLNMTYSATQSYIQKICRTRGFVPGIFAKDIRQQHKIQRLLDMFSHGQFTKATKYAPTKFSFRNNTHPKGFIADFVKRNDTSIPGGTIRNKLSKFLDVTGKDINNDKTLLDLYTDPKLDLSDKLLLEEYIGKTNEKNEDLDPDVQRNTSSLTGSILTKSQSVVEQMIKIDENGFNGKDGDTKEDMKKFSETMQEAIPRGKMNSQEQTKFFLGKFMNRFGERFSGTKKTELLKRLKWCHEHPHSPDVEDILYYGIVGEIVSSLSSRPALVPDELADALGARKNFFRDNLDTILCSDVVSEFGSQSQADLVKYKPQLEPRENSAVLLDREDKTMYMYGLPKEQKQSALDIQNRLRNTHYINKPLYDLADGLTKKFGIINRFKKDVHAHKKLSIQKPAKATGAKIRNTETVEKVRRILEGKPPEEDAPDEYISDSSYDDYYDMAA